jgi:prepilin signal peptidase PulO-like enzyme (type II secretory pathway)
VDGQVYLNPDNTGTFSMTLGPQTAREARATMSFSLAAIALVPGSRSKLPERRRGPRAAEALDRVAGIGLHELRHGARWYDNALVSYLVLRGRCRGCGTSIGMVYPAVELLAALLVAACFLVFGFSGDAFVASFCCLTLVTVSATDLSHRIVPNVVVLPAAAIVLVAQTLLHPSAECARLGASLFLFLAALPTPREWAWAT